jgi:hypothetical protein
MHEKNDGIFPSVEGQPRCQPHGLAGKIADEIFSNFRGIP